MRPMDPSCGLRILLFEALLIFRKIQDALDTGLPTSTTCGISFLSADFAREIVPGEKEDGRPRSNVSWTVHEVAGQQKKGVKRTRKKR